MNSEIQEGRLVFEFLSTSKFIKLDETVYYRNHYVKIQNGLKAIDILVIENNKNYFIEIKDYTHHKTQNLNQNDLINSIIKKVLYSLGMMYSMSLNANDNREKDIAKEFLQNQTLFIIIHIEIPPPRRTLKQSTYNLSNIQMELRNKLKPITNRTNIKVVSKDSLENLPWSVIVS